MRRRNHFPDWLFYILAALAIVGVWGSIKFYYSSESFSKSLFMARDSLAITNNLFKQGQLSSLYNNDSIPWKIEQMHVTYLDSDGKLDYVQFPKTEDSQYPRDELIKPNDKFRFDMEKLLPWNGVCLFYSFRLKASYRRGNVEVTKIRLLAGAFAENVDKGILKIKN